MIDHGSRELPAIALPLMSEMMMPERPVVLPSSIKDIMVPHPEIVAPSSENPSTVLPPTGKVKFAASA